MSQTSFSLYNFETTEKSIMNHIIKLNYQQMGTHQKFLDQILDPLMLCDIHSEIYQFYNEKGFYCAQCIVKLRGEEFRLLADVDRSVLDQLERNLTNNSTRADISQIELPKKDFSNENNTVQGILQQTTFNQNGFLNDKENLKEAIENRQKFVENKEFIHHISRDVQSHKAHQEFHTANKLDTSCLQGIGNKPELIDQLIRGFLQGP